MNKLLVGNFGSGFSHSTSSTLYKVPKFVEWRYNELLPTTFWCDNAIQSGINCHCSKKLAWLIESRDIISSAISFVKHNSDLVAKSYKYLFTHNKEISDLSDNFILIPSHGFWVEPQEYIKSKMASLISSNKNWTEGHRHRLSLVEKYKDMVDIFGRGIRDFDKKEEALGDYYFHFCIENDSYADYWSEKLLDALVCKCLVFYYGCPQDRLKEYFNLDSIIPIENFQKDMLTKEFYKSRLLAIEDNYKRALEYDVIEDIIFNKYLKDLI